jgi:hypothetical protein
MTTLNVLSKGRAFFGIGAAWFEKEHHAFGVEFPPLKERFERLEDALRIYESIPDASAEDIVRAARIDHAEAVYRYRKAIRKGVVKVSVFTVREMEMRGGYITPLSMEIATRCSTASRKR